MVPPARHPRRADPCGRQLGPDPLGAGAQKCALRHRARARAARVLKNDAMTHPFVLWSNEHPIGDAELGALLTETYVGGGFTDPAVAARLFEPGAVRARGDLLHVRSSDGGLAGVLILVRGTAPASRFAGPTEAE